jgi:16S rRNA processing protein RimM
MIEKETVHKIGYFTKPHGIKGEIGIVLSFDIFSHTDNPFVICEIDGILVPFFIEEYRNKTDSVVLVKLDTIHSEKAVREFSNREVYYPLQDTEVKKQNTAGRGGWTDFMGYAVSDQIHGPLGVITAIDESTANILLQIDNENKKLLIPAVDGWIVSADRKNKRLNLSVPDGLLDL